MVGGGETFGGDREASADGSPQPDEMVPSAALCQSQQFSAGSFA